MARISLDNGKVASPACIEDIVGRDAEISRYWTILERQGLVLSAERRIGKTHIAIKMLEQSRPQFVAFYQDLEGIHSVRELLRSIYGTVERALGKSERWKARLAKWATLLPQRIGGIDLTSLDAAWPPLLSTVFDDLVDIAADQMILLIWDEFPLMIYNISKREGERLAIELLDHLRALRQRHSNKLRFLLTGSIGLHLVLRTLQRSGNANDPVNDLYSATVPEMPEPDALKLATALLKEIRVDPKEVGAVARAIHRNVGGFPYYVHHVVDQLQQLQRPITQLDVERAVDVLVYDSQDPANFRYYLTWISTHYDPVDQTVAFAILDVISRRDNAIGLEEIINLVRHKSVSVADEHVRCVLNLLVADHYLQKQRADDQMGYGFRWTLVRRWWKESRS
jgi:hypothetical protein